MVPTCDAPACEVIEAADGEHCGLDSRTAVAAPCGAHGQLLIEVTVVSAQHHPILSQQHRDIPLTAASSESTGAFGRTASLGQLDFVTEAGPGFQQLWCQLDRIGQTVMYIC